MTTGYKVIEVWAPDNAPVECSCGWHGTAETVADIERCALTAGDPSPIGRCPDCDGLVYLAENPLLAAAPDMLHALQWALDDPDSEILGTEWESFARAAIAKAMGMQP